MRELVLLRHAEAVAAVADTPDSERPLSPHGEDQACDVGAWLVAQNLAPDSVLCSSACRARMTAALVLAALVPPLPPVTYLDAIYNATAGELLASLTHHGSGERVLLVGHHPGLPYLVTTLCPTLPSWHGMSPATLARIVLDGPAEPGRGRLVAFRTG